MLRVAEVRVRPREHLFVGRVQLGAAWSASARSIARYVRLRLFPPVA